MTQRDERIRTLLHEAFEPVELSVRDDSALHAGHAGNSGGGETHFSVAMVSAQFRGQGRVARSRAVHAALAGEFAAGLHALALSLRTPEEAAPPAHAAQAGHAAAPARETVRPRSETSQ